MKTDKIFNPKPEIFGMRGDAYLWDALETEIKKKEVLSGTDDFTEVLIHCIEEFIQENLTLETQGFVSCFAKKGTSSGYISGKFWLGQGIPLLIKRFETEYKVR